MCRCHLYTLATAGKWASHVGHCDFSKTKTCSLKRTKIIIYLTGCSDNYTEHRFKKYVQLNMTFTGQYLNFDSFDAKKIDF